MNRRTFLTLCSAALILHPTDAVAGVSDEFDAPGTRLDTNKWTTEFGNPSFLGRTQLRDWVHGNAEFVVSNGEAQLALNTFNPTGFSLYGTHAKTLMSFAPTDAIGFDLTVRLRLTSLQRGIVYGIYFYGCDAGPCATNHDELDIEIVSNFLQPGTAPRVQLNRYANEPLGAGHGPIVPLRLGFDQLASHEWRIRWLKTSVSYFVDGALLFSATSFVPQGRMQANIIVWAPAADWSDAFHASLQPVASAGLDQRFVALVDRVSVSEVLVGSARLEQFVTGFYTNVLGRAPEPTGLRGWAEFLATNCNPEGFAVIARGFFDSEEFRARPLTLTELVTILYRTFLGREPDAAGLLGWVAEFRRARLDIARGFIRSPEFFGLLPDRTDRAAVTALVTRLYVEILGRAPEATGLRDWVDYIVATGDLEGAALGFLASGEFEARSLTFQSYVRILYRTFLGRAPDLPGLLAWEQVLRDHLLGIINGGFVPSPEFQGLIAEICGG